MTELIEFETERLRLRQWKSADRAPFAALNDDKRVMEFFPSRLSRAESDAMADRCESLIRFIGYVGLHTPAAQLPFSPCVEILWRLAFEHWRKGLATEAAKEALRIGFQRLGLAEIVSFTTVNNRRSRAVMERLGMTESGIFEHPSVPEESGLRLHCLYRVGKEFMFSECV